MLCSPGVSIARAAGRSGAGRGGMAAYFTNIGPKNGPFLWRDSLGAAIGVLEAPDNHSPIGMALPSRWNEAGVARWKLTVHGVAVPGLWLVIDRRFVLDG